MIIYLVRHLPTKYNRMGIYMGRSQDLPIIPESIESFLLTIRRIKNNSIILAKNFLVYSSPALRCRQMAQVISDVFFIKDKPYIFEALNETNYGLFEGKLALEIKAGWPEIYRDWMQNPSRVCFPEGESFKEVQERAVSCLLEIVKAQKEKDNVLFIVSHVDVIKMIVCWLLDIPIDQKRMFCIDNGSVTRLETTDEKNNPKKIKVRSLNWL